MLSHVKPRYCFWATRKDGQPASGVSFQEGHVWGSSCVPRLRQAVLARLALPPVSPQSSLVYLDRLVANRRQRHMGTSSSRPATAAARKFADNAIATNSEKQMCMHGGLILAAHIVKASGALLTQRWQSSPRPTAPTATRPRLHSTR